VLIVGDSIIQMLAQDEVNISFPSPAGLLGDNVGIL